MKVVSDAGPLIALGKLGSIDLPFRLYGQILIPRAVYVEVVNRGNELGAPDAKQTELAIAHQQIAVVMLVDRELPESVRLGALSHADQQALALALRERADWVLIDDLYARRTAKRLGLKVKGTIGVIAEAFRKKLLSSDDCDFLLQSILRDDDIWIDEDLVRQAQQEIKKGIRGG
ncbi:MAG: hypothetical protein FJ009_08345 [Chloroflexi bacterium]|nr:hypothetical protein [Chloroflexota bacterium]